MSNKETIYQPSPDYIRVDTIQVHRIRRKQLYEKHPEVKQLDEPAISSAAWVLFIVASQIALSLWLSTSSWLMVVLCGYLVGACYNHAMWVLIHDLTHDAVFHSKTANTAFHLVANLPIVFPSAISFRYYHRLHHAYLNELVNDPDVPSQLEADLFGTTSIGKITWFLFFPFIQTVRIVRFHSKVDFWTICNVITQLSFDYLVYEYMGFKAIFYLFLSSMFSIGLHPLGARWIAEHYAFRPDQETYSYYGPANLISFNIGYHNEHHDLPNVPWNKLPAVKAIAPEFYDHLHTHNSYTGLLFEFITNPNYTLRSRIIHPSKSDITRKGLVDVETTSNSQ